MSDGPSIDDVLGPPDPGYRSHPLPELTADLLPDQVGSREVVRLVALEARVAQLEGELLASEERRSHSEFQLRNTELALRIERRRGKRLRGELKRLMAWLDKIQQQVDRLYATGRWRLASSLRFRGGKGGGFPGLDSILDRYDIWRRLNQDGPGAEDGGKYPMWLAEQRPGSRRVGEMLADIGRMHPRPSFALVLDAGRGADDRDISVTLASIRAQVFEGWSVYVNGADAGVNLPDDVRITAGVPEEWPGSVTHVAGIVPGDLLEPQALVEIAASLNDRKLGVDLIYTDEDELNPDGSLGNPFLKPAWSPDTLDSVHYTGALAVYRREFLGELGIAPRELTLENAYATVLRAAAKPGFRAERIPRVLYHRKRLLPEARARLAEAELAALREALRLRNEEAEVSFQPESGVFHVRRSVRREERVAILIPTRDRLELLRRCLESLVSLTAWRRYEVTIIDNGSRDPVTLDYLAGCGHRVFRYPGPFNYAAMHNAAVAATDAPWLLFLNNDTEIIGPGWLHALAGHVQRPEVGAVGAKLLFPDGTVQHGGVVLGVQRRAAHAFAGMNPATLHARAQLQMVRNYSAVTAACMMVRREVFDHVGGFDETRFPVAYNDVDFCVRALRLGYRNIVTPEAVLKHHECATRPRRDDPREVQHLHAACLGPAGWSDPFYHPALNHDAADFTVPLT